ncbi:YebC/PmpR family DNA-binding transcriptional regulator [Candidatus Cyanaurora vandensis]|uniref:YebC/PmpR family DNA-binding transcriptional regulator n=1 Tax=Candidatus Cyanaurora vandensis TaxID=2714958 RepID=UPI00258037A6|nr:YebC/PmpR family DNA-binding transcriptional regulator [Candidatus Cyanaurora vandensis]
MAGHSKWAQIKRQKGKNDVAKGALFARLAREIIVATQLGGADHQGNFRLRTAIELAKTEGLPNENIHRAVLKGAGALAADRLEEVRYEAYGPSGVALIIEALTDNRNRTAAEVRGVLSKSGGNLGELGSVSWLFQHLGVVELAGVIEEDRLLEDALTADAKSYKQFAEGVEVYTDFANLEMTSNYFKNQYYTVTKAELQWLPDNILTLTDLATAKQVLVLIERLEDLDDVQQVASNAEFPDALWAQLAD